MMWVLDNEKYSTGKTRCSTDGSDRGSSHKRSSHRRQVLFYGHWLSLIDHLCSCPVRAPGP